MTGFDLSLLTWLHALAGRNSIFDLIVGYLASSLPYFVTAAALVVLLIPTDRERRLHIKRITVLWFALLSALIARFSLTPAIRTVFPRTRPFEELGFVPLISHELGGSFPSGHAVFFFSLATTVWLHNKRLGWVFYVLAAINSIARVIAGVHWTTDIVGGALIGILVGVLAGRILHIWYPKVAR
jgi:undecaprenyl-diphosphatase